MLTGNILAQICRCITRLQSGGGDFNKTVIHVFAFKLEIKNQCGVFFLVFFKGGNTLSQNTLKCVLTLLEKMIVHNCDTDARLRTETD